MTVLVEIGLKSKSENMDDELLILEVEKHRVLYDTSYHFYKDNARRERAWTAIDGVLEVDGGSNILYIYIYIYEFYIYIYYIYIYIYLYLYIFYLYSLYFELRVPSSVARLDPIPRPIWQPWLSFHHNHYETSPVVPR